MATAKKKPAAKKRVARKVAVPAKKSIKRKSQITGKAPTKRLVSRRAVQAKKPIKGYFPNPAPSDGYKFKVQIATNYAGTKWKTVATFADLPRASEYANALMAQRLKAAKNTALVSPIRVWVDDL